MRVTGMCYTRAYSDARIGALMIKEIKMTDRLDSFEQADMGKKDQKAYVWTLTFEKQNPGTYFGPGGPDYTALERKNGRPWKWSVS